LPFGLAILLAEVDAANSELFGDAELLVKAMFKRKSGLWRCLAARRGREGSARTDIAGLQVVRGTIALPKTARSSVSRWSVGWRI